jgi:hypothetical protein
MNFTFLHWMAEHPPWADESAMGAINRPLRMFGLFRYTA